MWHDRCLKLLCEQRTDPTDPTSEPDEAAGPNRQRTESIEEARRPENGGEKTDLTAVVFEPTAGRIAEQSCSPRDRHGGFLDGPRCGVRNPGLDITDNFAEIGVGRRRNSFSA